MPSERKLERLVNQLIQETVNRNIRWNTENPPNSLIASTQDMIDIYLEAEYKEKNIAIFERRIRTFDPEHDDYFWVPTCHLGFREGHLLIWESYDPVGSLWTLLRVAKDSAADVDKLIDSLID